MRWSAAGLDHPRWWIYFTRCLVHTRAQQSFGKTISPTFSITSFKRSVIYCDGLLVVCHLVCIRLYLFFLLTDLVCLCYGFLCFYVSVFFEYFLLVVITTSVDCLERVISRMTNCMLSRTLNHAYSPHTHCIPCLLTHTHCIPCLLTHTHCIPCLLTSHSLYTLPGWGEGGAATSVGWQITLCDPIDKWRPVVLMWISRRTIRSFFLPFFTMLTYLTLIVYHAYSHSLYTMLTHTHCVRLSSSFLLQMCGVVCFC